MSVSLTFRQNVDKFNAAQCTSSREMQLERQPQQAVAALAAEKEKATKQLELMKCDCSSLRKDKEMLQNDYQQ